MSNTNLFEATILIRSKLPVRKHPFKDMDEYKKELVMHHIERRTREQAEREAQKFAKRNNGKVLSCRKADRDKLFGDMGKLPIENSKYVKKPTTNSPIVMDEFVWKKNRSRRIEDNKKDKNDY
jgi:hypothetical protein